MLKHKNIDNWLTSKCRDADNIFDESIYSDLYKSYFGLTDNNKVLYKDNDIDDRLKINFTENLDKHDLDQLNSEIAHIDFIPVHAKTDNDIEKKLKRRPIYIPFGTNHSNANFLFKLLKERQDEIEPYEIPIVSSDPSAEYNGTTKIMKFPVNKEKVYNFVYIYSKKG